MINLGSQLQRYANGVQSRYHNGVNNLARDITEIAKETIRHYIQTTPSGIVEGKPDRIWTGAMLNNADSKATRNAAGFRIEYGWFGFSNPESNGDYVKLQELGGGYVASGMHSFHAVRTSTRELLDDYRDGKYFG